MMTNQMSAAVQTSNLVGSPSFSANNPELYSLPQGILCNESHIRQVLAEIDSSGLSLADKVALLEQQELWPFLSGSRLSGDFRLHIEIADDLKTLRISKIDRTLSAEELNGVISLNQQDLTPLATIPNPNLIFSCHAITEHTPKSSLEMVLQLFTLGKRITTYRGVPVSWDQSVDRKVWTTNIDTVSIINNLYLDGVFERDDIRAAMELGVGGGAISKTLAVNLPALEEITATDISPYALACAKRNIAPALRADQKLNLYLGKGLRSIQATVDLLVVNPPYVPHVLKPDAVDPYRGTGLIKELIEIGQRCLNPANPKAAVYLGTSNLADRDFEEYLSGTDWKVTPTTEAFEVPLKIMNVNENRQWIDFLIREHGLRHLPERLSSHGFEFWHEISVRKLTRPE